MKIEQLYYYLIVFFHIEPVIKLILFVVIERIFFNIMSVENAHLFIHVLYKYIIFSTFLNSCLLN